MSLSKSNTRPVTVDYADGSAQSTYAHYQDAVDALTREYPDCAIGHDGDLIDDGDRTLVWACDEDAFDDDGANAIASIRYA